ncbi:8557_t:CDS:2, partial [Ambispora gerdemannii]
TGEKNTEKVLELLQDGGDFHQRPRNSVESILPPSFLPSNYHLIVGEHGTGKTTLIQNYNRSPRAKGFICRADLSNASQYPTWDFLSEQLLTASLHYKRKYKRLMVLIIDQSDRIAKKVPEFLVLLQDFAKDGADKHTLVIIFVSNEGLVPQLMASRSAWSRAYIALEVDISDEEAMKYLRNSGIDQETAEYAVKYLTGGRFARLSMVKYQTSKSLLQTWKKQLFLEIANNLRAVEVPRNHEFFTKLLNVHHMRIEQAEIIMPFNMLRKLVEVNILKQSTDGDLSFHERCVETLER